MLALPVPAAHASPTASQANRVASEPLDPAGAIAEAVELHPGVEAARLEHEALLAVPDRAGALPDPMLGFTHMFEHVETANGPSEQMIEVSQEVPWRGKRTLRAGIARREADAALRAYHAARLDVAYDVRAAYSDLYRIDASLEILDEEAGLLDRLERVARTRYAAGSGGQSDVLRAQAERSRIEERVVLLESLREEAAARWNEALGRSQDRPVGPAVQPPNRRYELPEDAVLYALARGSRPEIDAARDALSADRLRERLARKEYRPDFRFGLQWNRIGASSIPVPPDSGQDAWAASVGVTIPLWRTKLRAGVREARSRVSAAESRIFERESRVEQDVRAALAALDAQHVLVSLYETTLIPQADAALRAVEAAYRGGKGDFLAVLDAERSLLSLRLDRAATLGALGVSLAALERAVGLDLEDMVAAGTTPADTGSAS